MLVGEIGISRHEFLYELTYKEIILITRGYFNRAHPSWEQARFIGYQAAHCMGVKNAPKITEWWPLPWEHEPDEEMTDDELAEIREMLQKENEQRANGSL